MNANKSSSPNVPKHAPERRRTKIATAAAVGLLGLAFTLAVISGVRGDRLRRAGGGRRPLARGGAGKRRIGKFDAVPPGAADWRLEGGQRPLGAGGPPRQPGVRALFFGGRRDRRHQARRGRVRTTDQARRALHHQEHRCLAAGHSPVDRGWVGGMELSLCRSSPNTPTCARPRRTASRCATC